MPDTRERPPSDATSVVATAWRVLTFRADRATLLSLDHRHLVFGLVATWLVGMGRWWDDPRALLVQKLGTGSVAYVFALATIVWLLLLPLRPNGLSWKGVLVYVTLTAPPAALYAIPVERWMTVEAAMTVNAWFLGVVAAWRVALVAVWMVRGLRLPPLTAAATLLLPVIVVVWALAAINPERAVAERLFDLMSGVRERPPPTSADAAFRLLQGMSCIGTLLFLPLLIVYVAAALRVRTRGAGGAGERRVGHDAAHGARQVASTTDPHDHPPPPASPPPPAPDAPPTPHP